MDLPFLRPWFGALLDLFYPPHCGSCGIFLIPEQQVPGLCGDCLRDIEAPPSPCCSVCSHRLEGNLACPNCAGRTWRLTSVVAASSLTGSVRGLLHRFKYGRERWLAVSLGGLFVRAMRDPRIAEVSFDALVPVPLHPVKEREREFNQAGLLAGRLSLELGVPVRRWLSRTRMTPAQAGSGREERMRNLEGAFRVRGTMPPGTRILLVDDVCTTGSTLDACAAALKEGGALEVFAVVVARG